MLTYVYDDLLAVDWRGVVACHGSAAVIPQARQVIGRAYREWRHDRDITRIADVLGQLSDRQLRLLGLNRATLITELETVVANNAAHREYTEMGREGTLQLT